MWLRNFVNFVIAATRRDAIDAIGWRDPDARRGADRALRRQRARAHGRRHDLVAGDLHVCALRRDGAVVCWGWNQRGHGTESETAKPARVVGLDHVVQVAATWTHTCALRDDGEVFCSVKWSFARRESAGLPAGVTKADLLAVGDAGSCVRQGSTVSCWGHDGSYSMAQSPYSAVAVEVPPMARPPAGGRTATASSAMAR